MTILGCISSLLVAYGFSAIWLLRISFGRPELLVLASLSAFFWYLSSIISSLVFLGISEPQGIVVSLSVLIQEVFRWICYRTYFSLEQGFRRVGARLTQSRLGPFLPAMASGLGFGLCDALLTCVPVISLEWGKGTLYFSGCSFLSYFKCIAIEAVLSTTMHALVSMVMFRLLEDSHSTHYRWKMWIIVGVRLIFVWCAFFLNVRNGCWMAFPLQFLLVVGMGIMAARPIVKMIGWRILE